MYIYLVYFFIIIILVFVLFLAAKAIIRGINAKKNSVNKNKSRNNLKE